jgi:ketosteroid isomerase-like protein
MSDSDPLRTIMRMLLRSIDNNEWSVVEALLHPATEYEVSGYVPFKGRDTVLNYYKNVRPVSSGTHYIHSLLVEGDTGVCTGRFQAKTRDGKEMDVLFADVMTFENKKIRQRRVYYCELKGSA